MHLFTALMAALFLAPPSTAPAPTADELDARVAVVQTPPAVRRVVFDPKNAPANVPRFSEHESAGTLFRADCRVRITHELLARTERDGEIEVSIRVNTVRVELALEDLIYIPNNASLALRTHEEGHRAINERLFASSGERVARAGAREALARTWTAKGASPEAAANAAVDAAAQHVTDAYRRGVLDRMARAGEMFDRLTEHGKSAMKVSSAVDAIIRLTEIETPTP